MNIALCLDDNYFEPTYLLVNSIIQNNKTPITFFLVFESLSEANLRHFIELQNDFISFKLIKIDKNLLSHCPIREGDHVSLATYYRLLLPKLLPQNIDKILYLDGDMLCFDNLTELYETDITNFAVAACPDSQCLNEKRKAPLGLKNDTLYFGAGMLLINLSYWRENKIDEKSLEYIKNNAEKLLWHDQDTLNVILEGKVKYVDFKYNFYETFFKIKEKSTMTDDLWEQVQIAKSDICLCHYTQAEKPWFFECEHPLKDIYRFYYKSIFGKKLKLKFKYKGKPALSLIKRKILSKIFNFPMNKNYEKIDNSIKSIIFNKLK
jgi:lipopolysaccharide biosynthesis glycosyltransferase